jgi:hypothetical protein
MVDDFAQGHLGATAQIAGVEDGVHVGLGQAVKAGVEVGNVRLGAQPDRIDAGAEMSQSAVRLDEAHDRDLLGHGGRLSAFPRRPLASLAVAVARKADAPGPQVPRAWANPPP